MFEATHLNTGKRGRQRELRRIFVPCLVLILFLVRPGTARSQNVTGSIVGTITDPSGAVFPDGTVSVTNIQTQITRTVTSGKSGDYAVFPLEPGEYTLKASGKGFRAEERDNVVLLVNTTLRIDFKLSVGSVTETVKVTGAGTPLLDSQSSTVGTVIENKQVVEMPLNGRGYTQLILLTPGAVPVQTGQLSQFSVGGAAYSIDGQRSQSNNYTLDGVENNENYFQGTAMSPSIDAIQEFKIQSNVSSAEFGRAAGVNINVATKSGTNHIHGDAYEFLRNSALDALPYSAGLAAIKKSPFKQNDFGATIGGPIKKNRAFVFLSYEGFRNSTESSSIGTVPTAAMRGGNLAAGPPIFDPASTQPDPANPGQFIRTKFSGGIIPTSRLNPAALLWMEKFVPLPNLPGTSANYVNTESTTSRKNQYIGRIDVQLSNKDSVFVRYAQSQINDSSPGEFPATPSIIGVATNNIVFAETHVFNPSTVAEFKAAYTYTRSPYGQPAPPITGADFVQQTGISSLPPNPTIEPFVPALTVNGQFAISQFAFEVGPNHTYQYIANLTHTNGQNTLKVGFDNRNYRNFSGDSQYTNGQYDFSSVPTANPEAKSGTTGTSLASFLLGYPISFYRIAPNPLGGRANDAVHPGIGSWDGYIQDDWRVTSKLTMNLGLRYEYNSPPVPRDKPDQYADVDFPSGQTLWASTNPETGQPANVRPSILEPDRNNFAPRFGFAYQMDPKTVIRGGAGVFYTSTVFQEAGDLADNPPFVLAQAISVNTSPSSPSVDLQHITFGSTSEGLPTTLTCYCTNRKERTGYSTQWNLGVQQEIAQNLLFEINYIGNKGTKLELAEDRNQPLPGPGDVDSRRPIQGYGYMDWKDNEAWSVYHSLQVKVEKRFSNGLNILSFYTWSHNLDNTSSLYASSQEIMNTYDPQMDKGPSDMDIRNNFVFSGIYELPIGPGKKVFAVSNPFFGRLLQGWEVADITSVHSGTPVDVFLGFDNANVGGVARPDVIGSPNLPRSQRTREHWFNTSAFVLPAPYTFGDATRNDIISPGAQEWDIAALKNTTIREGTILQFRAEFFNAFNHVNLAGPETTFNSPTFGQIFGAGTMRQIQFALKVKF